jgi:hypothetical protein
MELTRAPLQIDVFRFPEREFTPTIPASTPSPDIHLQAPKDVNVKPAVGTQGEFNVWSHMGESNYGRMARGGHGLPKVLLGAAVLHPSTPCGQATPEKA